MKKIIALLLALCLLSGLLPLVGLAAETPYFIAINDALPELTRETTPIRIGGVTYVPYSVFDRHVTGVNLGISYAWDTKTDKITIYAIDKMLEFNIKTGLAYSHYEDREYAYLAVYRNGIPYLPAASTGSYFGLSVDFLVTEDAQYQLLRLRNGKEVLDNRMYLRTVQPLLEERSARAEQTPTPEGNNSGQTSKPPTAPTESTNEDTAKNQAVYVSFQLQNVQNLDGILLALAANRRVKVVFFLPPSRLAERDELLRELVGQGHKIGLIPEGTGSAAQLESLREGNRLLVHILRQKAHFVLDQGLAEETRNALAEEGLRPWAANISITAQGQNDSAVYQSTLTQITARSGKLRLLFDESLKGGTLTSILRQLQEDGYDLRALRETDH